MTELRRLGPHDPVPESGRFALVLRRLGEDAPGIKVVELIRATPGQPARLTVPARPDGTPMDFEEAVQAGQALAEREGFPVLYALDRTAGPREQEVLAHGGDRSVNMAKLDDTDPEEGEKGTDLTDRPAEAGYNLTPRR